MMTTTTAKAPIHPGQRSPYRIPDTEIVVTVANLSRVGADVWSVETTNVGIRQDPYTRSYDSEQTARDEAKRLCHGFHDHTHHGAPMPATLDNPAAARTWNQVAYELDQANRRRGALRNTALVATLEAELAGLTYPTAA